MENKSNLLHDDFIDQSKKMINEIVALERCGKKKEAAKLELKFAKFKVEYYEQFIDDTAKKNYKKIYEDDYHYALLNLAQVRDKCMDLGIEE